MDKYRFKETDDLPVIEDDLIRIKWVNIGEGIHGDYNENNPNDVNLLRFDVSVKTDDGTWEDIEDASYCTQVPADTPKDDLKELLLILYNRYSSEITSYPLECSVKKGITAMMGYILAYHDDETLNATYFPTLELAQNAMKKQFDEAGDSDDENFEDFSAYKNNANNDWNYEWKIISTIIESNDDWYLKCDAARHLLEYLQRKYAIDSDNSIDYYQLSEDYVNSTEPVKI